LVNTADVTAYNSVLDVGDHVMPNITSLAFFLPLDVTCEWCNYIESTILTNKKSLQLTLQLFKVALFTF